MQKAPSDSKQIHNINRFMHLLLLSALLWIRVSSAAFFLKDTDSVVFLGESVTAQHLYTNYVEMWALTRFPSWKLKFRNVGINGDRAPTAASRFVKDVSSLKPTVLTVALGMNDGLYKPYDPATYSDFVDGLRDIAKKAEREGLRVAWITPNPVEKKADGAALKGYNETLEKFGEGIKDIAQENAALFIDQFHPFLAALDAARMANPKNRIGGGDEVHPGPPGQTLMAWAILKGMDFPKLVSEVEIDAASHKTLRTSNCTVTGLTAIKGGLQFERLDEAMPYFPADGTPMLAWAPVREELNLYTLQVKGLAKGTYQIRLDGTVIATYSHADLSRGVELTREALLRGPIYRQIQEIWSYVVEKNRYFKDTIFRNPTVSDSDKTLLLDLEDKLNKSRTPKPYRVEILALSP